MSLVYNTDNISTTCHLAKALGLEVDEKDIESNLIMGYTNIEVPNFSQDGIYYSYTFEEEEDLVIGWTFIDPFIEDQSKIKVWSHLDDLYKEFEKLDEGGLN